MTSNKSRSRSRSPSHASKSNIRDITMTSNKSRSRSRSPSRPETPFPSHHCEDYPIWQQWKDAGGLEDFARRHDTTVADILARNIPVETLAQYQWEVWNLPGLDEQMQQAKQEWYDTHDHEWPDIDEILGWVEWGDAGDKDEMEELESRVDEAGAAGYVEYDSGWEADEAVWEARRWCSSPMRNKRGAGEAAAPCSSPLKKPKHSN